MITEAHHVVVVEDEPVTRSKLGNYFAEAGYRVSEASTADETRALLADDPADLLLIDINLPGEDGLALTREQRVRGNTGIILVTGRTDEIDRIVGLEMGADEYVTKPFNARELLARAKNLLRRVREGEQAPAQRLRFDGWTFYPGRRELTSDNGDPVNLTRSEFELLSGLVNHPGEVLSRDRLMTLVTHRAWEPNDRTVDVLVRRLRQKLETDARNPELIRTAHGEGYYFAGEVEPG